MLAYCDYIAHTIIQPACEEDKARSSGRLKEVGNIKMDLAKAGYLQSTKRTVDIVDVNGKSYRITIEEL